MIKEAYVSFEVAKLLKEKGFDVPCFDFYEVEYEQPIKKHSQKYKPTDWNGEEDENCYSAPSHQMALAWLREKYNTHISATIGTDVDNPNYIFYWAGIAKFDNKSVDYIDPFEECEFVSNEEAIETALKYSLENLI